jgi:hypothetical protein
LRARDHTMLPRRDLSDGEIRRLGAFVRHIRTKAPTQPISPPSVPVLARRPAGAGGDGA